jgi:hypothetical protein
MGILDLVAGQRRSPRPVVITNALACPRNHLDLLGTAVLFGRPFSIERDGQDACEIAADVDLQLTPPSGVRTMSLIN